MLYPLSAIKLNPSDSVKFTPSCFIPIRNNTQSFCGAKRAATCVKKFSFRTTK
ncbi:hypothetical protein PISS_a0258 [Pseudoalteromonas issachenkonii]|uniref:Uncharacterized protein n=1 Tax=Pseudoalteromonas issachenkonii TaxID=152297 RepID=A0ABN5BWR6_9GAMM|nr:hypothetical protein PISS_a0258 [Pseudoalteromonas issachenkonii]